MKKLTRKQINAWFIPVRRALAEIKTGEVECVNGLPVTRLFVGDDYARTDHCIAGFIGAMRRMIPCADFSPLISVRDKLAGDELLTVAEIDACYVLLNTLTKPLMLTPWETLKECIDQEKILIGMEQLAA